MKRRILYSVMWALTAVVVAGCGIDSALKSPPVEAPTAFTVMINVQPPTSLRTEDTWNSWMLPGQAVFQTVFGADAAMDMDMSGDEHSTKLALLSQEILIGRVTTEGYAITLKAKPAEELFRMGHDGPEEIHLDGDTHHLMVNLEDSFGSHDPHGYGNVPGATIHLELEVEGEELELELRPVQGRHGLRYEANASIPLGVYDIHAHIQPPPFLRDHETKDRWAGALEAELHDVDLTSGSTETTIEVGGMRFTLTAGLPKVYGAYGMGHLPLAGAETVNFSVRLEDETVEAPGQGEIIGHCGVTATIINEKTGASLVRTLHPMFGEHGFHYGANLTLPTSGQILAGGVTQDAGGAVQGHDDGGH